MAVSEQIGLRRAGEFRSWQPHSIRAALTGLRKRGHAITGDKSGDGKSVYRLAGGN